MDLIGPTRTESLYGKRYILMMVVDFSLYFIVGFLGEKSDDVEFLTTKCRVLQNQHGVIINKMHCDNGTKFKDEKVDLYYDNLRIKHEFWALKTPR